MYVNITRKEDLDYLLEVLEEKGYRWLNGRQPTSRRVVSPTLLKLLLDGETTLGINRIGHVISGSCYDADTGFNEVFDFI